MATIELTQQVFTGRSNGVDWTVDLGKCPKGQLPATVTALIDQGLTIIMQRVKSGKDLSERRAEVPLVAARIEEGTYSFGTGGGGGPRLSYREKAERQVLEDWARENGWKAEVARKFGQHPSIAWETITRHAVLDKAQTSGMDEDAVKALDLPGLVEANMETVKLAYASVIDEKAEKLRTAAEKPSAPTVAGIKLG